jgi:hypothetical protein
MSVAAVALKKPDERAALRSAVADAQEARAAVVKAQNAIERAEQLVAENQTKLASATKAVADAQSEDATRLASVLAAGGTSLTARAARQARTDEAEAVDDVEAARSALASLREALVETERDAAAAGRAVDDALRGLMEPIVRALIAEARAHRDSFLRAQVAMTVVAGLRDAWDPLRKEASFVGLASDADGRVMDASRQKWEAALKALRKNADAPLPNDTPPT